MMDYASKYNYKMHKQSGFSLVEVIIAMVMLLFIMLSFVPLFSFIHKSLLGNRVKMVAYNLAKDRIEQIRSMLYINVGTYPVDTYGNPIFIGGKQVMGDPGGNIPFDEYKTDNGIKYKIETSITWVDDYMNGVAQDTSSPAFNPKTFDPLASDYKKVVVIVTSPELPESVTQKIDLHTVSALEGEETASPGGNILVKTVHGWSTNGSQAPAPLIDILLKTGPDAPKGFATDDKFGMNMFHALTVGDYTVHADGASQGMMIRPVQDGSSDVTVTVIQRDTKGVTFEVDKACHLSLKQMDNISLNPVTTGAIVVLSWPLNMKNLSQETYTINSGAYQLSHDDFGDIWPVGAGYTGNYDLTVQAPGYRGYKLIADHKDVWDGTFAQPGDTKDLVLYLVPLPNVTVTDSSTGLPISGATVSWFIDTYTYNGTQWTGPVASATIDHVDTDGNGIAYLPDNEIMDNTPKTTNPTTGSTYTCYGIKVNKTGYYDEVANTLNKDIEPAFWVSGTQQMYVSGDGPANAQISNKEPTCSVSLDPGSPS